MKYSPNSGHQHSIVFEGAAASKHDSLRKSTSAMALMTVMALMALIGANSALAADAWTGTHLGVHAAGSRYVSDGNTTRGDGGVGSNANQESASVRHEASGLGVSLSMRRRLDSGLLTGIEADLSRLDHRAENTNVISSGVFTGQPSASLRYQAPWLATVRLSAGWELGSTLVFASAGVALADEQVSRTQYEANTGTGLTEARFTESERATRLGWVLGAGAQWQLRPNWSLRAEYTWTQFNHEDYRFPNARGGAQNSYSTVQGRIADNGMQLKQLRVGLQYRFRALQ